MNSWSAWQTNCSTDYQSVWPAAIPPGTSIPAWAYLDVVTPDAFNVTAAQANEAAHPPESTATAAPTSASASVGFSSPLPTASGSNSALGAGGAGAPTGEPTGAPTGAASAHKSSNTGAIVGGVVGGIGGAAIIAGVIAFFVIKGRRSASSATYVNSAPAGGAPPPTSFAQGEAHTPQLEKPGFDTSAYTGPTVPVSTMPVYDPNDPSTFPMTGQSPSLNGSTAYNPSVHQGFPPHSGVYSPTAMGGQQAYTHQTGGYSGVAEV